jgi:RimJ/RimL family protein N-acetyltransferase
MLIIRKFNGSETELASIWAIIDDHKHTFLDDYTSLNPQDIISLSKAQHFYVVVTQYNLVIGIIWYSDSFHDLHSCIHILFRPKFYKQIQQHHIIKQAIDLGFSDLAVMKIKAMTLESQKSAMKLLKRFGFHRVRDPLRNETRQAGKLSDVWVFELHKKFWDRNKERVCGTRPNVVQKQTVNALTTGETPHGNEHDT